jgi:hypothetical protein
LGDCPGVHSCHANLAALLNAGNLREVGVNVEGFGKQLIAVANKKQPHTEESKAAADEKAYHRFVCSFHL